MIESPETHKEWDPKEEEGQNEDPRNQNDEEAHPSEESGDKLQLGLAMMLKYAKIMYTLKLHPFHKILSNLAPRTIHKLGPIAEELLRIDHHRRGIAGAPVHCHRFGDWRIFMVCRVDLM